MALVFKTPKSAINTYTKDIQNLGSGECPPCPECPEINLETADVEYTENGEYTLTPEGDGFSKVDITVNIDTKTPYNEGYAAGETAGIATGKAEGIAEQKAKLTSTTITENGTTTREDGWNSVTVNVDVTTPYNNGVAAGEAAQKAKLTSGTFVSNGTYTREDGYNSVTVNVPSDINNQDKTVDPSTSQQTVSADNGYSGLGQVTVNAVTSSIDRSIQPENIVKGVSILGVQGSYDPQPNLETGEFEIETVGTSTFTPDRADGFDSVEITVPAQPIGSTNNPFDNIQTVLDTNFEEGCYYDRIASGEINKATGYYDAVADDRTVFHIKPYLNNPDYDPELRPEDQPEVPEMIFPEDFDLADKNIIVRFDKENVSQINNQAKAPLLRSAIIYEFNDCDLFAINYNFEPTTWPFGTLDVTENGKVNPTGYAEINVDVQPTLQTKSVTPSDRQQVITPDKDYDGLSEVTVSGVTAAIDQNITASNIKDGVTILGVTGTYDPQPSLESKTASYTANGTYTITPSTGYDGMSDVEVTVNVSGGSGTQCPDWSSIGWDCNDVENSGLAADVAYTAQKKAEYEGGTISSFAADTDLVFAPNVVLGSTDIGNSGMFAGCTNLKRVPKFTTNKYINNAFSNCKSLWTANIEFNSGLTEQYASSLFNSSSLRNVTINGNSVPAKSDRMFYSCSYLKRVTLTNYVASSCTEMFYGCSELEEIPMFDMSSATSMYNMFSGCNRITTIPAFNTSNITSVKYIFEKCYALTTIPQLDFSKVKSVSYSNYSTFCESNVTTIGGFINLGKAFVTNGSSSSDHKIDLSSAANLTKESIMNVINNLAAPDDTTVTNATLTLSATSYALLTEEDIAIATAKRWSVVSA